VRGLVFITSERERRRKESEAIQNGNQKLIAQLERDARTWHLARYLNHIRAARRAAGDRVSTARFRGESQNYLDWAERFISQLDALNSADRTGEFEEDSNYHYQTDLDRMKTIFGPLLGSD
jgi:hypothetical protein